MGKGLSHSYRKLNLQDTAEPTYTAAILRTLGLVSNHWRHNSFNSLYVRRYSELKKSLHSWVKGPRSDRANDNKTKYRKLKKMFFL